MLVEVLSRENVSTMLGYSSIVAWLFAQMPQVSTDSKGAGPGMETDVIQPCRCWRTTRTGV